MLDRGDGTGEPLGGRIDLLVDALAALPPQTERKRMVVQGDARWATKALLYFVLACSCAYSVISELSEPARTAVGRHRG